MQRFRALIVQRSVRELERSLQDAEASELRPFVSLANGIQADGAAVVSGLRLPWSTGPVEGTVTKVKLRGFTPPMPPLLSASSLSDFEAAVTATYQEVQASKPDERAIAVAHEIALAQRHSWGYSKLRCGVPGPLVRPLQQAFSSTNYNRC